MDQPALDNNLLTTISSLAKQLEVTKEDIIKKAVENYIKLIEPSSTSRQDSWLGCMKYTGKIVGDIVSPVEAPEVWDALSE